MVSEQANETRTRGGGEILVMTRPGTMVRRYAVIEAIRSAGGRERFAISYLNESDLRMVIATACIVATGFLSREEALQACNDPVAVAG